jgi:hypothetical protein
VSYYSGTIAATVTLGVSQVGASPLPSSELQEHAMAIGDNHMTFLTAERHHLEASPPSPRRAAARVSPTPDRLAWCPPRGLRKLEPAIVLHLITEATVDSRATATASAR